MTGHLLLQTWETERLWVQDSTLDEVPELRRIHDALPAIGGWTGMEADPIQVALLEGALPPGGRKELFRLQSIRLRPAGELIGFLGTYHGFPDAETLWIVVLAFDPRFQRQGYGTELVGELGELAVGLGTFTRMRGFICLGNLPALRFFVQAGFDRIVTVADDPDPPHEAHVMLEKRLA